MHYLPSNMTHFMQSIDARCGRSTCIVARNGLDAQLMDANNMSKWKRKIIAGEQRILAMKLVGNATDYILQLKNNKMRVSYFKELDVS